MTCVAGCTAVAAPQIGYLGCRRHILLGLTGGRLGEISSAAPSSCFTDGAPQHCA
jgi:hypothetical protein